MASLTASIKLHCCKDLQVCTESILVMASSLRLSPANTWTEDPEEGCRIDYIWFALTGRSRPSGSLSLTVPSYINGNPRMDSAYAQSPSLSDHNAIDVTFRVTEVWRTWTTGWNASVDLEDVYSRMLVVKSTFSCDKTRVKVWAKIALVIKELRIHRGIVYAIL